MGQDYEEMFCPNYGGPCRGVDCREWNTEKEKCQYSVDREIKKEMDTVYVRVADYMDTFAETQRMANIQVQASLRALLKTPDIPKEEKEYIEKILQAPSSEVAQKLLDEMSL